VNNDLILEELLEETMSKNESTQNTTIKELRKIAKEKNIKGYSKMKKAELLQKINDQPFAFEDNYFTEFSKKSKIKIIEEKTNIILGREYDHNDIRYIRMGRNLQTTLAQELCNQLGEYNRNYFTLDDIANIERLLNIQIKIVAAECLNSIIYSGLEKDVKVYLYKNGNYFNTINSMTGFYGQSYYCEKCDKPYQNKDGHKCKTKDKICVMCFKSNQITKKTLQKEYIVKNLIDITLIKNV
jgi:hypothetical protein